MPASSLSTIVKWITFAAEINRKSISNLKVANCVDNLLIGKFNLTRSIELAHNVFRYVLECKINVKLQFRQLEIRFLGKFLRFRTSWHSIIPILREILRSKIFANFLFCCCICGNASFRRFVPYSFARSFIQLFIFFFPSKSHDSNQTSSSSSL